MENWIGRPTSFVKIDPQPVPAEALSAYVGRYMSPELRVAYDIVLENDALTLKRRKHAVSPLTPTVTDGFAEANGGYNFQFTRDEAGKVIGFGLTNGRVLNVRFGRLP